MNRVFISSTCYDLLDIRAELESEFRDLGLFPVLSDSCTSDFIPDPTKDSIDSCLSNLCTCQYVVVILDHRYGPSLAKSGYEDISATHYEYKTAQEKGIPCFVYVRDRLMTDLDLFDKSGVTRWVSKEHDQRLFQVIKDHQRLKKDQSKNWLERFRDSVHLKQLIRRDFRRVSDRAQIDRLIREDRLPLITLSANFSSTTHHPGGQSPVSLKITAVRRDAYRINVEVPNSLKIPHGLLAAGKDFHFRTMVEYPGGSFAVNIVYHSPEGHQITDTWSCTHLDRDNSIRCNLTSKSVKASESTVITILDA